MLLLLLSDNSSLHRSRSHKIHVNLFSSIFVPFSYSLSLIPGWIHLASAAVFYLAFCLCRANRVQDSLTGVIKKGEQLLSLKMWIKDKKQQ